MGRARFFEVQQDVITDAIEGRPRRQPGIKACDRASHGLGKREPPRFEVRWRQRNANPFDGDE
jgi:hypothetical protein